MKKLHVPLSYEDVIVLKAGDLVSISGNIWTCRSGFYKKHLEQKNPFPLDSSQNNVLLHSGPIIKDIGNDQYQVKAISITTSVRFNKWEPTIIKNLNMRAIIGKGKVGKETREAMKEHGCVHLSRTGTFAGAFALNVKEIKSHHWLDLGLPEALWLFKFEDFGPLVVETDAHGVSIYDSVSKAVDSKVPELYQLLGIDDFEYAEK